MEPITMAGVAGAMSVVHQVSSQIKSVTVRGQSMAKDVSRGMSYMSNSSLSSIASVARVEPLCLVDADCMNVEFLPEVIQSLQSIFSGYYLQAVNLIGTIGGVSVARKLGPLNPNRKLGMESHGDWRFALESYKHRLPTTHNKLAMAFESQAQSPFNQQAVNWTTNKQRSTLKSMTPKTAAAPVVAKPPVWSATMGTDKDALKTMSEATNLCVGKMYNVTLREGEASATVPIAIRLMVSTLPTASMVNLFTFKEGFDMDMVERYHGWRAGRLSFVKDLIMCKDLIEKHRSAAIKDKSGIYSQILGRESNNKLAGLLSSSPSLATASNLAVLSTDTIAQIEQKLNGKFSSARIRETVFNNTNLMIMAVIDKNWERVTFYHRGMDASTQASVRDMKMSNKDGGGGSGVMDIMKAYMAGSAPQL